MDFDPWWSALGYILALILLTAHELGFYLVQFLELLSP